MSDTKQKRTRTVKPSDHIFKHSPIKNGLVVKDEDKPLERVTKIMPKLYLGNYQAAKDADFFKRHNIRAVLNCTKEIPNYFASNQNIEYMRIPVDDSLKQIDIRKMTEYYPVIVEFLHKHIVLQGHNVFVHCHAGRQRSASAVAAYLISRHKMTPADACKLVMDKRKEAFHFGLSLNFEDSLNKYYKDLCKTR